MFECFLNQILFVLSIVSFILLEIQYCYYYTNVLLKTQQYVGSSIIHVKAESSVSL